MHAIFLCVLRTKSALIPSSTYVLMQFSYILYCTETLFSSTAGVVPPPPSGALGFPMLPNPSLDVPSAPVPAQNVPTSVVIPLLVPTWAWVTFLTFLPASPATHPVYLPTAWSPCFRTGCGPPGSVSCGGPCHLWWIKPPSLP
jgi:hypothetical protein